MRATIKQESPDWNLPTGFNWREIRLIERLGLQHGVLYLSLQQKELLLKQLYSLLESKDSLSAPNTKADLKRLCAVLAGIPVARGGSSCPCDFAVDSSLDALCDALTSEEFESQINQRAADGMNRENRDDLYERMFSVPAMTATDAVIYDRYLASNLMRPVSHNGTRWFIAKLLSSEIPRITLISDLPKGNSPITQSSIESSVDAIAGVLMEMRGRDSSSAFDLRLTKRPPHARLVRFDYYPRNTGSAITLDKGLAVFDREALTDAVVTSFSWREASGWFMPGPSNNHAQRCF